MGIIFSEIKRSETERLRVLIEDRAGTNHLRLQAFILKDGEWKPAEPGILLSADDMPPVIQMLKLATFTGPILPQEPIPVLYGFENG